MTTRITIIVAIRMNPTQGHMQQLILPKQKLQPRRNPENYHYGHYYYKWHFVFQ
jgi:hypothetical protein